MILREVTRNELINKNKLEDPEKYARRMNYVSSIKPLPIAKDIFLETGTLTVPIKIGDYIVTVHVSGIIKEISDELKSSGKKLPDRPMVYKALRKVVDTSNLYVNCTCPDFCLHGDTEIKLLNGSVKKISELLDQKDLWVYSTDNKGDFKPGKVNDVWISGYETEFVEITLDNDKTILTTTNHPYMLRDGSYLAADQLRVGQSLMPLYFKELRGYEQIKSNSLPKSWFSTYKVVANELLGNEIEAAKIRSGESITAIHHKDFIKSNNHPKNLLPMGHQEHYLYHSQLTKDKWKTPEYRVKILANISQTNVNRWQGENVEVNKQYLSNLKKSWWAKLTEEERLVYAEKRKILFIQNNVGAKISSSRKKCWDQLREELGEEGWVEYTKTMFGGDRNNYSRLSDERKLNIITKSSQRASYNWQQYDEETKTRITAGFYKPKTLKHKQKIGTGQSNYWKNMTEEQRKERSLLQKNDEASLHKMMMARYKNVVNRMLDARIELTEENYYNMVNAKGHKPARIEKYFKSFADMLENLEVSELHNHKVKSIKKIHFDEPQPIYDLSVENYHNFLVNAGVILHNCYRHSYWASKDDYKYGNPERRPADIRNPDNKGATCKHITTALVRPSQWLKYAAGWVSTITRQVIQQQLELRYKKRTYEYEDVPEEETSEFEPDDIPEDEVEELVDVDNEEVNDEELDDKKR